MRTRGGTMRRTGRALEGAGRPRWSRAAVWRLLVIVAALVAAAPATALSWREADRSDGGWCLVEHEDGDIQIWFGTYPDGAPLLTVDVRQELTSATLHVDDRSFAVHTRRREDDAAFLELEMVDDIEGFLRAAQGGFVLRAGARHANLHGLADALASDGLAQCLDDVGWPRTALPPAGPREGSGVLAGVIYVSGEIDRRLFSDLEMALRDAGDRPVVIVGDSPGGIVEYAERAARALRRASASVVVEGDCASACVSMASGGLVRMLGPNGRLGVHRTTFIGGADFETGQAAVAAAADFFREMGIDGEIALIGASVPSHTVRWLTRSEVRQLGLVTD